MRSRNTDTSNILEHMTKDHPDVTKLYWEDELEEYGKIKNLDMTNNIVRIDDAEKKTDISGLVLPKSKTCVDVNSAELSAENLKNLEELISERVQKLVIDTGFKELNNKVNELFKIKIKTDNKRVTKIQELQSRVRKLETECETLRSNVSKSENSREVLEKQLTILENSLMLRKIIIKNIKIFNREQPLQEVDKYFKEHLNLHNISIIGCNLLPRSNTLIANTETLLVELSNSEDCVLVVNKMHKLNSDKVCIEHVLPPTERKRRAKLMMVRKELLSRNSNLNIIIRKEFLLINKNKFYWDERYGLCHDIFPTVDNYEFTCAEHIEDITGIDLKEFLDILHKYDIE